MDNPYTPEKRSGKPDIQSMTLAELSAFFAAMGQPVYRAKQVFSWLSRGILSFEEMTDLPHTLRDLLMERFFFCPPLLLNKQVSQKDGTIKYLWELSDGQGVEAVLMRYRHGNTVCISSQAGCRMGCAFCASTLGGLVRNLTPGEMLGQIIFTRKESGLPISNVVLMGIGEPLDNFDALLRFLELLNHPAGLGIGMRHVSVSTCGLTKKIDKLADYALQLTLSVSLHAPDDETRSRIMPVNRGVGVERLIRSCKRYAEKTGRRISFEYAVIDAVNDSDRQADLLCGLLRSFPSHVNLIALNAVLERAYRPSRRMGAFRARIEKNGVPVSIRRSLGGDIDAACGQLRRKKECARWDEGAAPCVSGTGQAEAGQESEAGRNESLGHYR